VKDTYRMSRLKAAVVPGVAGQFEALVTNADECILRIEAAREWFSADELTAFETFVREVADRKGRPALRAI
jgi:hypothetical protein